MLNYLCKQASIPELQCQENSIAFGITEPVNSAAADYWPATRRVERVTVIGDKPV